MSLAKLKTRYWELFALRCKLLYADSNGRVRCFTCGRPSQIGDWDLHAGHYFKKSVYPGLWFHKNNCRPQCDTCNVFLDGNLRLFKQNLIAEIGEAEFKEMDQLKRTELKLTQFEYKLLITDIKPQIRELQKKITAR